MVLVSVASGIDPSRRAEAWIPSYPARARRTTVHRRPRRARDRSAERRRRAVGRAVAWVWFHGAL